MGKPLKDETGKSYGNWLVLRRAASNKGTAAAWVVRCTCGVIREVSGGTLRSGASTRCTSCGPRPSTHGMSRTPEYETWIGMWKRCEKASYIGYPNYGGRGISVSARWKSFSAFFADMGPRPAGHTLERTNNNRGYSKANCVWADRWVQANNCRSNVKVTFAGRKLGIAEWAREFGLSPQTVYYRYSHGYRKPEQLFTKGSLACFRRHKGETEKAYRTRLRTVLPSE